MGSDIVIGNKTVINVYFSLLKFHDLIKVLTFI